MQIWYRLRCGTSKSRSPTWKGVKTFCMPRTTDDNLDVDSADDWNWMFRKLRKETSCRIPPYIHSQHMWFGAKKGSAYTLHSHLRATPSYTPLSSISGYLSHSRTVNDPTPSHDALRDLCRRRGVRVQEAAPMWHIGIITHPHE